MVGWGFTLRTGEGVRSCCDGGEVGSAAEVGMRVMLVENEPRKCSLIVALPACMGERLIGRLFFGDNTSEESTNLSKLAFFYIKPTSNPRTVGISADAFNDISNRDTQGLS